MAEKCILSLTSHHLQSSEKEAGRHVKNVDLRETRKILKKLFAVHNSIFHFSKQSIIVEVIIMKIDNTLKLTQNLERHDSERRHTWCM